MFIPMPVLIAIGIAMLLVGWALRASRGRDPLMGGRQPSARPASLAGAPAAILPPEIEEQVRGLVTAGRKIEAIKLTREVTHLGLKESKDLVESME